MPWSCSGICTIRCVEFQGSQTGLCMGTRVQPPGVNCRIRAQDYKLSEAVIIDLLPKDNKKEATSGVIHVTFMSSHSCIKKISHCGSKQMAYEDLTLSRGWSKQSRSLIRSTWIKTNSYKTQWNHLFRTVTEPKSVDEFKPRELDVCLLWQSVAMDGGMRKKWGKLQWGKLILANMMLRWPLLVLGFLKFSNCLQVWAYRNQNHKRCWYNISNIHRPLQREGNMSF